jgi:molybdopterin synthase sulfur carrier subunit
MKINVQVFAALKDYFTPQFTIELIDGTTVGDVYRLLTAEYPEAVSILAKCKPAVNDCFVDKAYVLSNDEHLLIIPPSSGG